MSAKYSHRLYNQPASNWRDEVMDILDEIQERLASSPPEFNCAKPVDSLDVIADVAKRLPINPEADAELGRLLTELQNQEQNLPIENDWVDDTDKRVEFLTKEAETMAPEELKSHYVCNTANWMAALEARDEAQRERDALQAQVTAYEEHQSAEKERLKSFREGLLITIDQVGDGNGPTNDTVHDILEGFDAAFGDVK